MKNKMYNPIYCKYHLDKRQRIYIGVIHIFNKYLRMEKLFMQRTKTILTIIFLISLFVGCSTTSSIKTDKNKLQELNDTKMVSLLRFICSDPVIANNIHNIIIESLLKHYSVVIGDETDVVIKGTITLSNDQVSTASPGSTVSYISEISAQIIKNNKILDSIIVTQVSTNSSTPDPPEVMGREIGEKIKKALSNTLSFTP